MNNSKHTLVVANHNGAFTANAQSRIRFTQAGATLSEDSLDRWHGLRQINTVETNASSWDYRSLSTRPQGARSSIDSGSLAAWHDPGQYAWQNSVHGERMLGNQRQAIDARLKQFDGQGMRSFPGARQIAFLGVRKMLRNCGTDNFGSEELFFVDGHLSNLKPLM